MIFKNLFIGLTERFPRIYSLFKFGVSSGVSLLLDYAIYTLIIFIAFAQIDSRLARVALAVIPAQILSSIFNLWVNKKIVFVEQKHPRGFIIRYYILFAALMALRILLIDRIGARIEYENFYWFILFRFSVDVPLFLVSFAIQKLWVFRGSEQDTP